MHVTRCKTEDEVRKSRSGCYFILFYFCLTRFRIVAVFFAVLIAFAIGFDLNCKSINTRHKFKICAVESLTITSKNKTITSVDGIATPTTFHGAAFQGTVHYLPKGLGSFFPNLKWLHVRSCGLKLIQAPDLENLTALESLKVDDNEIEEQ